MLPRRPRGMLCRVLDIRATAPRAGSSRGLRAFGCGVQQLTLPRYASRHGTMVANERWMRGDAHQRVIWKCGSSSMMAVQTTHGTCMFPTERCTHYRGYDADIMCYVSLWVYDALADATCSLVECAQGDAWRPPSGAASATRRPGGALRPVGRGEPGHP